MEYTHPLRSLAVLQCCAEDARVDPSRFSWQFRTRLRILHPAPPSLGQPDTPAFPGTGSRLSARGLPAAQSLVCRRRGQRSTNAHPRGRDERGSSLALSE